MAQQAAPVARPTTRKRTITSGAKAIKRTEAVRSSVLLEPLPSILPAAQTEPKPRNPEPSEQEIRERAYQIYLERGGQPGHDVDDWFQAQRELRAHAA